MINHFFKNIIEIGFTNILLVAFVLLLIHQSIAHLLAQVEKYHNVPVQFYWYDIPISLFFIFLFIYFIYSWK